MNLQEYCQFVEGRTSSFSAVSFETRLATAAVGLTGEAAEILEEILNCTSSNDTLMAEVGDVSWYLGALSNAIEVPLEDFFEEESVYTEYAKKLLIDAFDVLQINSHASSKHRLYVAICLSIATGKIADQIKKMLYHGKEIDKVKLTECAKNITKPIMAFCYILDVNLEYVIDKNVEKLSNRYKSGKFTVEEFKAKEEQNG